MTELTELEKLERLVGEPITRVVTINGQTKELKITRIKLGRVPKVVRAAGPLMMYLSNPEEQLDLRKLMTFHSDQCLDLLAVLVNEPREVVDDLDIDEGVKLLADVVELNLDFFVRRVLPAFSEGLRRVFEDAKATNDLIKAVIGQKQSSTSSNTATESPTSGNTPT